MRLASTNVRSRSFGARPLDAKHGWARCRSASADPPRLRHVRQSQKDATCSAASLQSSGFCRRIPWSSRRGWPCKNTAPYRPPGSMNSSRSSYSRACFPCRRCCSLLARPAAGDARPAGSRGQSQQSRRRSQNPDWTVAGSCSFGSIHSLRSQRLPLRPSCHLRLPPRPSRCFRSPNRRWCHRLPAARR